jgi:hypothetical protein
MTNAGLDPASLFAHAVALAETNPACPETFKAILAALETEIAETAPAPVVIRPVDRSGYAIDGAAGSPFHTERACYATADDRVVGVTFQDNHDHDVGWPAWSRDPGGTFDMIGIRINLSSEAEATQALHQAMRQWAPLKVTAEEFQ